MPGPRELKKRLESLLLGEDRGAERSVLEEVDPQEAVGPLFALLLHRDEIVRWRAAGAFGVVVPRLAERDMERARVVMRRMMWHLNEESGNMGWGVPEAMGEVLAASEPLAREYASILASYVREMEEDSICHGNYLDNPRLRHGVYWALGRLAQERPEFARAAAADLVRVLDPGRALEGREESFERHECHDATARGLAAWALGILGRSGVLEPGEGREIREALAGVAGDEAGLTLWRNGRLEQTSVGALARKALQNLPERGGPS